MDKRLVYIGAAFLIAALLVFMVNNSLNTSILQGLQNLSVTQNMTVQKASFSSVTLPLPNDAQSFYVLLANFSKPVNAYLFNSSAYTSWSNAVSSNTPVPGLAKAVSLEGNGTFFIFRNASLASVPAILNGVSNTVNVYMTSPNATYKPGTYYFVIDNTNGSASTNSVVYARVKYLPPVTNSTIQTGAYGALSNEFQTAIELGAVFFFALVVGTVILIIGLMRKRKGEAEIPPPGREKLEKDEVNPEYVEKLYRGIGRQRRRRTAARKKQKRAGRSAKRKRKR